MSISNKNERLLSLCSVELLKLLPIHRYSFDIFSYSGPSGILGSDGKQNTAAADARGREDCCTFH